METENVEFESSMTDAIYKADILDYYPLRDRPYIQDRVIAAISTMQRYVNKNN